MNTAADTSREKFIDEHFTDLDTLRDQLTERGLSFSRSIKDQDFALGAIARIVTDPAELDGLEFSYNSFGGPKKTEIAMKQMPLVADLQQQI